MEQAGIASSVVSITQLSKHIAGDARRRRLARSCNEYAARLVSNLPSPFGKFTALPLPDIEGSLAKIEYGLDVLKTDGVGVYTCYHDKWFRDPAFDPVFAELDPRPALIYFLPSIPACTLNLVPGITDSAIEYGTDTTQAITRMMFGEPSPRLPDITMIWSHSRGAMHS